MSYKYPDSIQLQGEELLSMRRLVSAADDSLRQITLLLRGNLQQDAGAHDRHRGPKVARFYFDNIRVVIDDESGCSVYEDPPGICRGCYPGE